IIVLDSAPSATPTLSLHDALPICVYFVTVGWADQAGPRTALTSAGRPRGQVYLEPVWVDDPGPALPAETPFTQFGPAIALLSARSEEHTSELQSRVDLVCRLLLEK